MIITKTKNKLISLKALICFFFSISIGTVSYSQTLPFEEKQEIIYFTALREIQKNPVFDIKFDSLGLLYVGGYDGLFLWDGYKVKNFTSNPNDSNSILPGPVNKIFIDSKKNIWAATNITGLTKISKDGKVFTRFTYSSKNKNKRIFTSDISCIQEDKIGNIWIGSYAKGITKISPEGKVIEEYEGIKNGIELLEITQLQFDKLGNFWFLSKGNQLIHFNPSKEKFEVLKIPVLPKFEKELPTCLKVLNNDLIIYCNNHSWKYNYISKSFKPISTIESNSEIIEPNSGNPQLFGNSLGELISYSTGKGFFKYDNGYFKKIELFADYQFLNENKNYTHCAAQDRFGNIWYGTESGIRIIENNQLKPFALVNENSLNNNKGFIKNVRNISQDKNGNIWIGMAKFNLAILKPDFSEVKFIDNKDKKEPFKGYNINTIFFSKDAKTYLGAGDGLKYYNKQYNYLEYIEPKKDSTNEKDFRLPIWSINEIDKHLMLLGTKLSGLVVYDKSKNTKKIFSLTNFSPIKGNKAAVWDIYLENDSTFYLGCNIGLIKGLYHKSNQSFVFEKIYQKNVKHDFEEIWQIKSFSNNELIMATTFNGIATYRKNTNSFSYCRKILKSTGLTIASLEKLDDSRVWVGSTIGLHLIDIKKDSVIESYSEGYGIQDRRFYFKSSCHLKNGFFMFGGTKGINYFNPVTPKNKALNPEIAIMEVRTGKEIKYDYFNNKKEICISGDEGIFFIEFSSFDLTGLGNRKYRYKLNKNINPDKGEWQNIGTLNSISLGNLNPGTYYFHVNGSDNLGIWSSHTAVLKIKIEYPFFLKWWFIALMLIAFGLILYSLYLIFIKEKQLKRKRITLENTALRAQLNPHFIFNSLVSLQHFIIKNDSVQGLNFLSKFSRLMRQILENSKSELIPLEEEISFLNNYTKVENLRFDEKIDFQIIAASNLDTANIMFPPLLIQPLIENSIEHGMLAQKENGYVHINFFIENGFLMAKVEDNGIGREASLSIKAKSEQLKNSFGLEIVKQRINLLYKGKDSIVFIDKTEKKGNIDTGIIVLIKLPLIPKNKTR